MKSKFQQVALIGKYQSVASGTSGASGVASLLGGACDNGTGNSAAYNGFTVVDPSGHALGTVQQATVDNSLRLTSVRFQVAADFSQQGSCVTDSGVKAVSGRTAVQTTITTARLHAAVAKQVSN